MMKTLRLLSFLVFGSLLQAMDDSQCRYYFNQEHLERIMILINQGKFSEYQELIKNLNNAVGFDSTDKKAVMRNAMIASAILVPNITSKAKNEKTNAATNEAGFGSGFKSGFLNKKSKK